jgi:hypothetical protein
MKSGCDSEFVCFSCDSIRGSCELPPAGRRVIDIAVLDMHHGWPNLGHASILQAIGEIANDIGPVLEPYGLHIRALSYDVRRYGAIPEPPGERHRLYIGTGGPGHIDPRNNDGISEAAQGIREDPSWEGALFDLFDAIERDWRASLLAVCHTFGVLCRWSGIARPHLRGPEKGGKSSGVLENVLTDDAVAHPWFSRFSSELTDGRHFRIVDSRLFDLIPESGRCPPGTAALSHEVNAGGGAAGEAVTMVEFARDREGTMPRILAVNHHPEIRDPRRQLRLLNLKLERGEVSRDWYEERAGALSQMYATPALEREVMRTSQYTLLTPLRYFLYRQVRLRMEELGFGTDLHEEQVLTLPSGTLDRESLLE